MTASPELPALDAATSSVTQRSPLLQELQTLSPVCRVRTHAGDEAWLVTRYAEVKQLLHDNRLARSHPDPANAPRYVNNPMMDMLTLSNDPDTARDLHLKIRAALMPSFSARRILTLLPRIQAIADGMVDGLAGTYPPVDLHAKFSAPFSLLVLCELIGVPADDRGRIAELRTHAGALGDRAGAETGAGSFLGYLSELAGRKRSDPSDDVISRLCRMGIDDEHAALLAAGLLVAGLESVASHVDLGVVLFTTHPDEQAVAMRGSAAMAAAVEEVLRRAKTGDSTLPRYATEDVEVGGATIRAGDLVLLDFASANFDEREFEQPERFDVARSPNPHLSFGHGIWHCIGAPLARVELQAAFTSLFTRLPGLRLAVPVAQLHMQPGQLANGIAELPVTW